VVGPSDSAGDLAPQRSDMRWHGHVLRVTQSQLSPAIPSPGVAKASICDCDAVV